jgi:hypothetical protein
MSSSDPIVTYEQGYHDELVRRVLDAPSDEHVGVFRKTSRILAIQLAVPFIVQTDRGPMRGQSGDWLVTNHPDDDSGSDLWTISDERMRSTYRPAGRTFGEVAGEPVPYSSYEPS